MLITACITNGTNERRVLMVRFAKGLAIFFLVAGVIGGIVLGIVFPTVTVTQSGWKNSEESFNILLFILTLLSSGLIFTHLYVLAEILEHNENIEEYLGHQNNRWDESHKPPQQITTTKSSFAPANTEQLTSKFTTSESHYIQCKKCGEDNICSEKYCGNCGAKL